MSGERKTELPLKLDINFGEALERFVRVKPHEVGESVERSKTKKPPEQEPRRPARTKREGPPSGRKRKPSGS